MLTDYITEWTYIAVFILAAIPWIELIAVVPLGIVLGLNPIVVGVIAFVGNWITVMLLILLFDRFRVWREKKKAARQDISNVENEENEEQSSKRTKRAYRIWDRFGLPGLTLAGPFIVGSHISAGVAMVLKAQRNLVIAWMTLSLVMWTTIAVVVAYYSLDAFGLIQSDIYKGE